MTPSGIGDIVNRCWLDLQNDFSNASLDEYQIMPNHIHGIVVLWDSDRRDLINQIPTEIPTANRTPTANQIPTEIPTGIDESRFGPTPGWQQMKNPRRTLGKIIRHFKAKATKKIHDAGFGDFQWQSGFHDRIIRNDEELERIREYIRNNSQNWKGDDEIPKKNKPR